MLNFYVKLFMLNQHCRGDWALCVQRHQVESTRPQQWGTSVILHFQTPFSFLSYSYFYSYFLVILLLFLVAFLSPCCSQQRSISFHFSSSHSQLFISSFSTYFFCVSLPPTPPTRPPSSRLTCFVFCLLTNKNPNSNKLSWAINYPTPSSRLTLEQSDCLDCPSGKHQSIRRWKAKQSWRHKPSGPVQKRAIWSWENYYHEIVTNQR